MPVRVPISKSTVFEICWQKICRFRVNGSSIRHIFHRFQNVPASCERSLNDNICFISEKKLMLVMNANQIFVNVSYPLLSKEY